MVHRGSGMDLYDNTSAPWAWRLDPHSGSSSSLGPRTSTSLLATDSLTPLFGSSEGSSADSVFWQDFRPVGKRLSRHERKRARLHRFDSGDDERDASLITCKEEPDSEVEDANGVGHTSSEAPDSEDESDADQRKTQTELQMHETSTGSTCSPSSSLTLSSNTQHRQKQRERQNQTDPTAANTRLVSQAIHQHALGNADNYLATHDALLSPPPLTYKETVRLIRLIAMIFRFSKPSRRISRNRNHSHPTSLDTPTATSSTSTPPPICASTSTSISVQENGIRIQLKPKYVSCTSSSSSSRKPRILARVHSKDARLNSDAVLKFIALLPAVLPARVSCADWIIRIAVKAKRDRYGNILLPDTAYMQTNDALQQNDNAQTSEEGTVKLETQIHADAGEETEEKKVTRSMRQRLGKQAPTIPLPEFWRRSGGQVTAHLSRVVEPQPDLKVQAEVGVLTSTPSPIADNVYTNEEEEEAPPIDSKIPSTVADEPANSTSPTSTNTSTSTSMNRINLSHLVAERMRCKREAKLLLLRTHQTLRKRKSQATASAISDTQDVDRNESIDIDAETAVNTVINSCSNLVGL